MSLRLDVRHSIRLSLRQWPSTTLILVTLALAIGANAAIFSVVDTVLLRPLPYPDPDRLVRVVVRMEGDAASVYQQAHDGGTWQLVRDHARFLNAAVYSDWVKGVNVAGGGAAFFADQQRVGAGYFRLLGVLPVLGREFTEDEDRPGGPAVVIVSYPLWQRLFRGDAAAIGRTLTLKGEPHTVVGVMPAGFQSTAVADLWTPLRPTTTGEGTGANYAILARLAPGMSIGVASQRLAGVAEHSGQYTATEAGRRPTLALVPLQEAETSAIERPLILAWAAVGIVLLIGCANVAGLLLARGAARVRELATRLAIGGGTKAVVRLVMLEALLLALAGGIAGLGVAVGLLRLFRRLAEGLLPTVADASLDGRILAVSFLLILLTAALAAFAPAAAALTIDLRTALSSGGGRSVAGGGRHWSRRALVTAEVALAVLLLVGAGLLVRTLAHLRSLDPGFSPDHVIAASFSLDDARYHAEGTVTRLLHRGVERLRALPGAEAAAAGLSLPYERGLNMPVWRLDAAGEDRPFLSNVTYVTPGYFETLQIPLRRGRPFEQGDDEAALPVVIVNEAFARQYLADQDPLGMPIRIGPDVRTVVGVAGNVQQVSSFGSYGPIGAIPAAYVPVAQVSPELLRLAHTWFSPRWIVRSTAPPGTLQRDLTRVTANLDPLLPVAGFQTLDELRARALAWERLQATLLGALAGLAVVLAVTGVYGLVSQSVIERRRELGIRLALGATLGRAVREAALPGLLMAAAGIVIGCVLAAGASGALRSLIWGVTPLDPVTFGGVAAGLLLSASIASLVPAWRIVRLDPTATLREEG